MTLANELGQAGYRPRQIYTVATVTMEDIASQWTMTQIHLDVVATVPEMAQCDFVDAALQARANCPVSRALNANLSMRAKLSQGEAAARLLPKRNGNAVGPGIPRKLGPKRKGAGN
jgi:organic hydroperoxide reductase OsmC/OhrA